MVLQRRYAISARVIGAMHRDSPKVKMFLISILWSDESEVIVYRSLQDFKKFHRQLKKRFPLENPFRGRDRVIPKFKARALRSSVQQKGSSNKSVRRMRFLESYCAELLRCDPSVTQSSEVTQFLTPKDHDLQPDFTKNSIMILPSNDLPEGPSGGAADVHSKRLSAGNVTHPLVTQTYRCVAAHETRDTKNRPFKVGRDENLDVLIKDPSGWWLVENEDKKLAWFPAPYLESCEEEEGDDLDGFILGGALYCAVRSYSTRKHDEVSVPIGSVVEVLRKSDDGWWLIRYNGKSGYIPSMYLQPHNNPWAGLHSLQRKLHSSTLNLATASSTHSTFFSQRESQTGDRYPPTLHEENNPQQHDAVQPRHKPNRAPRLQHARSLDVLSEDLSHLVLQAPRGADVPDPDSRNSSVSTESDISSLSSGSSWESESSSIRSKQRGSISGCSSPDVSLSYRCSSGFSSYSFGSVCFNGGKMAPRMPPRPKTQEILSRCTTMTRKAALASQAQLLAQPRPIQTH